jgi:hypothetical protein
VTGPDTGAARRVAWRATVEARAAAAMATSRYRPLPDFLIVGAQRCGTTSLFRYLVQHPAIAGPTLAKGVHWFDTAYGRSERWYRAHFPTRQQRERTGVRAVGEASPYYLFHPYAAERIATRLPDVRVVAILRDPVERARSHHEHETARGFESLSLEAALDAERDRLAGADAALASPSGRHHSHQHHGYVARGRYAEQLERVHTAVGRERVLVLFTEDLDRAPDETVAAVHRFLGVPERAVRATRRWNVRDKPPLPEHVEARLRHEFADADARLAELLGRDLPWSDAAARR